MKKDFLDELIEALHAEEKKVTLAAPIAPHKVIGVFASVAKAHELTWEEKRAIAETAMSLDGITPDEAELLRELDASHDPSAPDTRRDFMDVLMEELQKLKDEQKKVTVSAPIPPHKVLGIVGRVAKKHEMTAEERTAFVTAVAALDGDISPDELRVIQAMEKAE